MGDFIPKLLLVVDSPSRVGGVFGLGGAQVAPDPSTFLDLNSL